MRQEATGILPTTGCTSLAAATIATVIHAHIARALDSTPAIPSAPERRRPGLAVSHLQLRFPPRVEHPPDRLRHLASLRLHSLVRAVELARLHREQRDRLRRQRVRAAGPHGSSPWPRRGPARRRTPRSGSGPPRASRRRCRAAGRHRRRPVRGRRGALPGPAPPLAGGGARPGGRKREGEPPPEVDVGRLRLQLGGRLVLGLAIGTARATRPSSRSGLPSFRPARSHPALRSRDFPLGSAARGVRRRFRGGDPIASEARVT